MASQRAPDGATRFLQRNRQRSATSPDTQPTTAETAAGAAQGRLTPVNTRRHVSLPFQRQRFARQLHKSLTLTTGAGAGGGATTGAATGGGVDRGKPLGVPAVEARSGRSGIPDAGRWVVRGSTGCQTASAMSPRPIVARPCGEPPKAPSHPAKPGSTGQPSEPSVRTTQRSPTDRFRARSPSKADSAQALRSHQPMNRRTSRTAFVTDLFAEQAALRSQPTTRPGQSSAVRPTSSKRGPTSWANAAVLSTGTFMTTVPATHWPAATSMVGSVWAPSSTPAM